MNTSLPKPPVAPEPADPQKELDLAEETGDESDLPDDDAQRAELAELEPEEPVGTPASNQPTP